MKKEMVRYYIRVNNPREMMTFINKGRHRFFKLTASVIAYNKVLIKVLKNGPGVIKYLDDVLDKFPGSSYIL